MCRRFFAFASAISRAATENDFGPKAATYLTLLGWISLLGLNFGGLIWLWFAAKLRARSDGFRKAAIILLGLHVLMAAIIPFWLLISRQPVVLRVYSTFLDASDPVLVAIASIFAIIYLIPLLWLLGPGTRAAFERRLERGLCLRCGYNLAGNTSGVCPECGALIPAASKLAIEQRQQAIERLVELHGESSSNG